ncbi:MAG: hypothetical protein KDB27_11910 [Planctomycetales bacterium]|nr:hypothetical protein [Planctomycetales bacterium]
MGTCFVHPECQTEKHCPYCSKPYCDGCLLLHGPIDRIVCKSCFDEISRRLRGSIFRRWFYAAGGLSLGPYLFYLGYIHSSDTTMSLVGIGALVAGIVNVIRIKTYRDTLRSRPYANGVFSPNE